MTAATAKAIAKNFFDVKDERLLFMIGRAAEASMTAPAIEILQPDYVRLSFRLDGRVVTSELKGPGVGGYFT
jgi:hypothetical protein